MLIGVSSMDTHFSERPVTPRLHLLAQNGVKADTTSPFQKCVYFSIECHHRVWRTGGQAARAVWLKIFVLQGLMNNPDSQGLHEPKEIWEGGGGGIMLMLMLMLILVREPVLFVWGMCKCSSHW